jgi:hypothetical protein
MTDLTHDDEATASPFQNDDEALEAFVHLERLKKQFGAFKKAVEEALIGYIEDTKKPLMLGDQAIKVGTSSTEPCRDVSAAVDKALTLLGGDIDAFVELLARNALKPGACGTILGPEFRKEHFEKKWKTVISATGARKEAHKYLQRMPKAFAKPKELPE